MSLLNRRAFGKRLAACAGVVVAATGCGSAVRAGGDEKKRLESRIRGLLAGSLIGDALGGPVEFQDASEVAKLANPPKRWTVGEKLSAAELAAARSRLCLRPYAPLRPEPGSYAHWTKDAAAGTVTDDSRHKMVLFHALRKARAADRWPISRRDLAQAYLDWERESVVSRRPEYQELSADWLDEWQKPARWILGERDTRKALPPERMWTGLPTCCGQMTSLPLAGLFPGKPEKAYLAAWALGFFDNGTGRDLNAALVAGLATALSLPPPLTLSRTGGNSWRPVLAAMRETDPYQYGDVRYTVRPVEQWLRFSRQAVDGCENEPAKLFTILESKFASTIKWQAEVPFVVSLSLLMLCPDRPLAALQLSIEWGHDTDSYAALTGAFIGARYGAEIFPEKMRNIVSARLEADYEEDIDEWLSLAISLQEKAKTVRLVAE